MVSAPTTALVVASVRAHLRVLVEPGVRFETAGNDMEGILARNFGHVKWDDGDRE
jgi:hypothetical protein